MRRQKALGHRSPGVWFLNVMGGKAHAETLYPKLAQIASIISKKLKKNSRIGSLDAGPFLR